MWMVICGVIVLGAVPGQMSVIPAGNAAGEDIIIHSFGAMDVGLLILLAFMICREHLFCILSLSLACRADTHVDGLARGRSVEVVCSIYKIVHWPIDMF